MRTLILFLLLLLPGIARAQNDSFNDFLAESAVTRQLTLLSIGGDNVTDTSGNGVSCTANGTLAYTDGPFNFGRAFRMSGDDYISLGAFNHASGTPFTLLLFAKHNLANGYLLGHDSLNNPFLRKASDTLWTASVTSFTRSYTAASIGTTNFIPLVLTRDTDDNTQVYSHAAGTLATPDVGTLPDAFDFNALGKRNTNFANADFWCFIVLNRHITAGEAAEFCAGPEPLNTSACSIQVQGGGDPEVGCTLEINAASVWDDRGNGSGSTTRAWRDDGVDIGQTSATLNTSGMAPGDVITLSERRSNSGGYDAAEDTLSSNSITLVEAEDSGTSVPIIMQQLYRTK